MAEAVLRRVCIGSLCVVAPHPRNAYRPYALRHPVLAFLSTALIAAKIGTALLLSLTPDVAALSTVSASFLIEQTNAARKAAGLPALQENSLLARSAALKAQDMLAHDYFEHTSPLGVTPWHWFDEVGYNYISAGENLAIDFTTGEALHEAWMRSPGHRRNMVSDKYRDIGIAVATGELEGRTTTIVVQHLGARTVAPDQKPAAPPPPQPTPPVVTARPTTPAPLAPPEITEPREGQLLPSGAATVRGTSTPGSTVDLFLDGASTGSYPAPKGTFQGTFTPPVDQERDASLEAAARIGERTSARSVPRRVTLDTRGPVIAASHLVLLPHPTNPERLVVLVPVSPDTTRASVRVGDRQVDLAVHGQLARGEINAAEAQEPLLVRADDQHGNTQTSRVTALPSFNTFPRTAGEEDARARVLQLTNRVHTTTTILLFALALLLSINILVYVRIQQGDIIAHTLFVLVLTGLLVLTT